MKTRLGLVLFVGLFVGATMVRADECRLVPHVDAEESRESATVSVVTLTARDRDGNLCSDVNASLTMSWAGNAPGTFLEPSSSSVTLVGGRATVRVQRPVQTETTITRLAFETGSDDLLGTEIWLRNADDVRGVWVSDPNGGCSYEVPESMVAAGFSIDVRTDRPYNMFTGANEDLTFTISCTSKTNVSLDVTVKYHVMTWDGADIATDRQERQAAVGEKWSWTASFNPPETRGIYFVVANVTRTSTNRQLAFTRTNLVRLPAHSYSSTAETSIFGIADWWPVPTHEAAQSLLDRLGIRWVRSGDLRFQHTGRAVNYHNEIGDWNNAMWAADQREHWAAEQIEECLHRGSSNFEFGNEVNLYVENGASESSGIGLCHFAPAYVEWVKTFDKVMKENGWDGQVGLLGCGMSGFDHEFAGWMRDAGILPMLKGFCVHAQPAEYVPDYPYQASGRYGAPEREPGPHPGDYSTPGTAGGVYWNFLGTIRAAQDWLARYAPGMPLWVTEMYSPSQPNYAHSPSERDGADNVVLEYALLKAEGVKAGMFYMMCDSIGSNRFGMDPNDREYTFGLLRRDLSFKPSAMGYCAIAEALDGATFTGWMKLPDEKAHGLLFNTPRGPLAVLWGRWDGMLLSWKDEDGVCNHKNPWENRWWTKKTFDFAAHGDVTCIDSIGRARTLTPAGGIVSVELSGSPCLVYGLDSSVLATCSEPRFATSDGLTLADFESRIRTTDGRALEQFNSVPRRGIVLVVP